MSASPSSATRQSRRPTSGAPSFASLAGRSVLFFVFWLMISKLEPTGAVVGVATATLAAALSLKLLPPGRLRLRPVLLALFAIRFAGQSVRAGFDVARRAFDPRLPIHPGFIAYPLRVPPGGARAAFCALSSLLPGSLPTCEEEDGTLLVHCLDTRLPVADGLAEEERLFMRAVGAAPEASR